MSKYTLDAKSARALATTVAKQSNGVSVKIGETNGKPVLHLVNKNVAPKIASRNVTSEAEWDAHPWNRINKKKEAKEADNTNE